jgi:hypothetical protein
MIENKDAASIKSIQAFVLGDLSMPVNVRMPDTAEQNMGAIPIAGRALSETIPCGRRRHMPSREASTVITRS